MTTSFRKVFFTGIATIGIIGFSLGSFGQGATPKLPNDYRLVYSQNFEGNDGNAQFVMTDSDAWAEGSITVNGTTSNTLELKQQSQYKPPHRSPFNMAYVKSTAVGDFVLDVNLLQTGKEYGHRDMCLFFGYQDPSHFYYVHMATATDDHAHNIFIVNDAPRIKISEKTTKGIEWGTEVWHHVRLIRKASTGLIQVYYDNMDKPIMEANDDTFGLGHIGFGSFDDTGMVDNIKIWSNSASLKKPKPFATQK